MKWSEFKLPPINLYTMPKLLDAIDGIVESKTYKETIFVTFKSRKEKQKFLEIYNKRKNN